jgi:hypothetical protein
MKKITIIQIMFILVFSSACSKGKSVSPIPKGHDEIAALESDEFFAHPDEVKFYNPNQADIARIKECAYIVEMDQSCKIGDAPLLGMVHSEVTIEDILNRTMATKLSHIEKFKYVLTKLPKEVITMFGAVNAIIISEKINPSFYIYSSATIYLSAAYFWTTPEEKKAALAIPDFRENFAAALMFEEFSYFYDNDRKDLYASMGKVERSVDELLLPLAKLLVHELAHANDYFPKSYYKSENIDLDETFQMDAEKRYTDKKIVSQTLATQLGSPLLLQMGQIMFRGITASETDANTPGKVVYDSFANDVAADFYGYSSIREDLATLLDSALTFHFFKYNQYDLVIKYPTPHFVVPDDFDYPIAGAIKNKFAAPNVRVRAEEAIGKIFNQEFKAEVAKSLDTTQQVLIPEDTKWDDIFKH